MTIEEGTKIKNKMTIRKAREAAGYTKENVTSLIDVTEDELDTYEKDASYLPIKTAFDLLTLYGFSFNEIHFR